VTDALARAGELARDEAKRLFALDVYDPNEGFHSAAAERNRAIIDRILVASGMAHRTPYKGNATNAVQWCGCFACACWKAAGLRLSLKECATYWTSTDRFLTWARYSSWEPAVPNPLPDDLTDRRMLIALTTASLVLVRPGDVVIVGNGKRPSGDHVTIAELVDLARGVVVTLSGNGAGDGPDGKHRNDGIVRKEYSLTPRAGDFHLMFAGRPAFRDLQAEKT
jgi:hypothetical protein